MKKDKCCECGKETTSYINILTGKDWKYESYCLQCARVFFSHVDLKIDTKKMSLKQLNGLSYQWDNHINQNAVAVKNDKKDWSQIPNIMKQVYKSKAEGHPKSFNQILESTETTGTVEK